VDYPAPVARGPVARVRAWLERTLGVGLPTYAASGGSLPASPVYPVDASMAAMAANPWVWSCVQAIVTDLAGLPLVVESGTGLNRQQTSDHWLLRLLDRPSPRCSGRRFRRQLVADLVLSGNAYIRVWRGPDGRPVMLGRILPARITADVGPDGEEVGWTLSDGRKLTYDDVLHVADVSWVQDRAVVYGESPIHPVSLGLQVQRDARRQAGRAAKRGRLEMMLTPDSPEVALSQQATRAVVDEYAAAMESGAGVYVVNKHMRATPLTLNARDGEFMALDDRTRSEILAVFAVPQARVGDPAANYGTSKQQGRVYWETLQGRAALIDDELSRLAEPGVRVRHSFAGVDALQTARTERLARVGMHIANGMDPNDAAAYEGFVDAPRMVHVAPSPAARPPATKVDEPRENTEVWIFRALFRLYQQGATTEVIRTTAAALFRPYLEERGDGDADDRAVEMALTLGELVEQARLNGEDLAEASVLALLSSEEVA
jgi:HK97 family phage portal protein